MHESLIPRSPQNGESLSLDWRLGCSGHPDDEPDVWFPATVPGAVQLDWAKNEGWPPHSWDMEALRYRGLEDRHWHYRSTVPELPNGTTCRLVLRDVDHFAEVRIGKRTIATGGGIGRDVIAPLDAADSGSDITVIVLPTPKESGREGRSRARRTTKAPVGYGWDFHPDLIPLGIASGAWIERLAPIHIHGVRWRSRLSEDLGQATFQAVLQLAGEARVEAELIDAENQVVWQGNAFTDTSGEISFHGELSEPRLWWPLGQGEQVLYEFRARVVADDQAPGQKISRRIGFQRTRLTMAPGQWDEPSSFPKSRSLPPFSLEINGRRIFCKGANIVGPDIFPGTVDTSRWGDLVRRAAAANMNTLRVWGGAPSPPDCFYEACDEAGIMVVQEFPLACNDYPDNPDYLAELRLAASALVERLTSHPCRILWSGGNELFNAWSGMTDQSHALRLVASVAWENDPDTPFVPTLPIEGVGHGYYLFRDPKSGVECFELFQKSHNTAYTEFGVPGASPIEVLQKILPAESLWPPTSGGAWNLHSGMEAWDVEPTSYLCISTIEHYWGPQSDLGALLAKSHWLQSEGLKSIIEEARRQRPTCGWAVLWCFNEPWPTAANQCLITHCGVAKPAYTEVTQAMRPTLASARVPKFQWAPGETFRADLYLLHDAPTPRSAVHLVARLRSGDWESESFHWEVSPGPGDADVEGPTVRFVLPEQLGDDLTLELVAADERLSSKYRLATRNPIATADSTAPRGLNV